MFGCLAREVCLRWAPKANPPSRLEKGGKLESHQMQTFIFGSRRGICFWAVGGNWRVTKSKPEFSARERGFAPWGWGDWTVTKSKPPVSAQKRGRFAFSWKVNPKQTHSQLHKEVCFWGGLESPQKQTPKHGSTREVCFAGWGEGFGKSPVAKNKLRCRRPSGATKQVVGARGSRDGATFPLISASFQTQRLQPTVSNLLRETPHPKDQVWAQARSRAELEEVGIHEGWEGGCCGAWATLWIYCCMFVLFSRRCAGG